MTSETSTPREAGQRGPLDLHDVFAPRHIGPNAEQVAAMLAELGLSSLDELIAQVIPAPIRAEAPLEVPPALTESELIEDCRALAGRNEVRRAYIGLGYHNTLTPAVILRNVLENPGWYTQYTPYQAEISQGRLEALLNFQTMVADLTGLPVANASLLDEGTAAAEAMALTLRAASKKAKARVFFVSERVHPQTIAVLETRARPLGVEVRVGDHEAWDFSEPTFGVLVQYPTTDGQVLDYGPFFERAKAHGARPVVAADLLSLTVLREPAAFGAEVVIGNSQRFGVPLGFGGPHAAFMAISEEHRKTLPGRLVGVSRDAEGRPALRLALQAREQHIRRDRATSNICTAQVLLAVMASMYGVYHGPDGLRRIARRIRSLALTLARALEQAGYLRDPGEIFDTLRVRPGPRSVAEIHAAAGGLGIELRRYEDDSVGIALDETVDGRDIQDLLAAFGVELSDDALRELADEAAREELPAGLGRESAFMENPVFHEHRSETQLLRYMTRLASRDLSLTHAMIPLGSCTMKLNATAEMIPVTFEGFGALHPFAPLRHAEGYLELFRRLESYLADMTGFAACSLQPNAGSQGEYAGLLAIRGYHESHGEGERDVCLIPTSAHGTNPASAIMAGMRVVGVKCDEQGNIDTDDLEAKAEKHKDRLAALMITYPSTHGVFEEGVRDICELVHARGGQVYLDGANMNALVGLCRPGDFGADVCHLNLHKTLCLAEGTPVRLSTGLSQPIEALRQGELVTAWSEARRGLVEERLIGHFKTGVKACVELTLQDGRTITCTPDHRVLTTEGWVEAQDLELGRAKVILGLESALDDPRGDLEAEAAFQAQFGDVALTMDSRDARLRSMAFFRILGALSSDGTHCVEQSGRLHMRLNFGVKRDAELALADIELLTGKSPTLSRSRKIWSLRLPAELARALSAVPGLAEAGRRVESTATLPEAVMDLRTPAALRREYFAALFGGDGVAPLIVHLRENPSTLREVRFVQTRKDPEVLSALLNDICVGLGALGVEAYPGRITETFEHSEPRFKGFLTVKWGAAFAERIGFRYCTHKQARLSAATAWWRMRETVPSQRQLVASRALETVAAAAQVGPNKWRDAVGAAYRELDDSETVLNSYFASFAGNTTLNKAHLTRAVEGHIGLRKDVRGLRRSHRRATLPPVSRSGQPTGMPEVESFLEDIGARSWFNDHLPGPGYEVTYATESAEDEVAPTMEMTVVGRKEAPAQTVYDLTVENEHNFLANGIVVHNCIPHGGGGPGVGPICVAPHLVPFLPSHPMCAALPEGVGAVSAAPWGSASILPISYAYIRMMGPEAMTRASQVAILNANYIAARLDPHFPVLYRGARGRVAHECIIDLRPLQKTAGVTVEDVAKRLMDYGFHAPTMSWPVSGTLMIEPTESEDKGEIDRLCDALIAIRAEIAKVESGAWPQDDNPLKNAPHTAQALAVDAWDHPYSREVAVFPAPWVRDAKFWPSVARIDNVHGDRNLICTCPSVEELADAAP